MSCPCFQESGVSDLELGLERAGMTTVGQVEIDPYCRQVLAKHWPEVPRHDDVRTASEWWLSEPRPRVDVVCGGFPCQDISQAGRQAGIIHGVRSSLWSYMAETVRMVRPSFLVVENVAAILVRDKSGVIAAEIVAADLAEIGYQLQWDCIPASAVGAPHRRDRWFGIAANVDSPGFQEPERRGSDAWAQGWPSPDRRHWWRTEPNVGRVVHGISSRLDRSRNIERIHALGNAVVPQVAEFIGRQLMAQLSERAA